MHLTSQIVGQSAEESGKTGTVLTERVENFEGLRADSLAAVCESFN
jgi:hypothetical protein